MKKLLYALLLLVLFSISTQAQSSFTVNGLCIAAPRTAQLDEFVAFIDNEIAPAGINTLILRVDFNYAYASRPELSDKNPLTKEQVKKLVAVCKKHEIDLIPQVNLLGHQSWASTLNKLLAVYPEFDETPHVKIPEKYEWPNDDGLYCKSYCPLHPGVHAVVFDLIDEIVEVFEADAFHAGMDEVFYIADEKCPRCMGKDPAQLFAGEVTKISDHLNKNEAQLWIWGDRLIDATTSGIGMWEASMNNTWRAVDMIPKSVIIADWHYEKALPTPAYFSLKGFDVVACSWRKPQVARDQVQMINALQQNATPEMKENLLGVMHTVWSSAENFMEAYAKHKATDIDIESDVACFKAMTLAVKSLQKN
ncbi:family 20 glycosylhydrolase [Lutimonas halocynthiae]|uniref:family 20 glycosylhydrolase n=1 Tax=Lutimonas halocynthiae TaxID=1446477 RepID=UPI0025B51FA2|nr:family 20 glycosylhydrolase [Lutimonas halocynthiae]MDN3642889.1 family 20 glycosylhydrolase [Lutimonas halocynthiae]